MTRPYQTLRLLITLTLISLLMAGCSSTSTQTPNASSPTISSFTASKTTIAPGDATTLAWQVSGGTPLTLSLNQGIGVVTDSSYTVSPTLDTTYTLTATNSAGQTSKTVTVTLSAAANQAPTVTRTVPNSSANQGATVQTIDLTSIFSDVEDGSSGLSFSVTSSNPLVSSASVSGSSLVLNFGKSGTAQITITARDKNGSSTSTSFSVTVNSSGTPPTNLAPVVNSSISNKSVTQGATPQTVDLTTIFSDAEDGTKLIFSASSSNPNVVSSSISGSTLTLNFVGVGTAQLTVTAKDSGNLSTSTTFSVTVSSASTPTNQAPTVISAISNKSVTSGASSQSVNLKSVFTDTEDGTNLTFSAVSSNTSVVNVAVSSGNLTLTFGSTGTAQVTVTAQDSGNLSATTTFNVTVSSASTPTNQAPTVISSISNKSVTQGAASQSVNLKTVFNDAEDGTNLTFTASSSNTSVVTTSVSNGTLSLTFGTTGTAQVTATAKDSGNLSTSSSFSVTVSASGGTTNCISANFMNVQPYAGNSSLPDPVLTVTCTSTKASIYTNAIPNHVTGTFPNANNPNSISAQSRTYPLSLTPALAASVTSPSLGTMGLAINGIALEPMANEYYNNDKTSGWQYEALATTPSAKKLGLDDSNAHVQPNGNYHYHGLPDGLVDVIGKGTAMTLIGYLGDGFPVYAVYGYTTATDATSDTREMNSSYRVKSGTRPSGPGGSYDGTFVQDYEYVAGLGDLDQCNGRFGVTPEYPNGIYHYYMTNTYPFIPRCFSGTPESMYTATPK